MWDNPRVLFVWANGLITLAVLMLLCTAGLYLMHAPWFALNRIRISGALQHISAQQAALIAQDTLSGTLFTLDLDTVHTAFKQEPWVSHVTVRRLWPNSLDIVLEEYQVLARWANKGLIDHRGIAFQAASVDKLPLFYGPEGTQKEMAQTFKALEAMLLPIGLEPTALFLSARGAWRVKLNNGLAVELGRSDIENRVLRFATHWTVIKEQKTEDRAQKRIEHHEQAYEGMVVDMRYPNGFAISRGQKTGVRG